MSNPSNGVVVHGEARIGSGAGGNLQIQQSSRNAIINWESFSIDPGELTQFVQEKGPNSAVLNRVTGGDPTAIHGALRANGNVFVINPNGILVGPGGAIDVNGLVLSTLDITNGEFLAGGDMNFKGVGKDVTNLGRINAVGGDVFLIGKTVSNSGSIRSESGTVGLAAGEEVLLTAEEGASGERMFVRSTGSGVSGTGVYNDGTIEGAAVELKAHGNMYALAINNKGSVRATGATTSGGRVYLRGAGGTVRNSGSIRATSSGSGSGGRVLIEAAYARVDGVIRAQGGQVRVAGGAETQLGGRIDVASSGGRGGDVVVEGDVVSVGATASVDASGTTGGGNVRIGGGFQGRDATVRNADTLTVAEGSMIRANATGSGRGGNVILWADGDTLFEGDVSAHGVSQGGFAEISGKMNLSFDGEVDVLADEGPAGTLLLDPTDITISSQAESFNNVNNVALSALLDAGNNVVISTNFGAFGVPGNLTVGRNTNQATANGDRIDWYQDSATTTPGTLTLLATGNVTFNTSVRSAGVGGINVVAGWNGITGVVDPINTDIDFPARTNNAVFDMAAILATLPGGSNAAAPDAAGLAPFPGAPQGSIFVNTTGGATSVEVGSRFGATQFAAHDIILKASDAAAERFSQVGFRDTGYEFAAASDNNGLRNEWWASDATTTPTIGNILGKDYKVLFAGVGGTYANALTNGFRPAGSGATGAITLRASGRIDLRSSDEDRGYVQVGHGGSVQEGFEVNRSTVTQITTRDGILMDPIDANWQFFGSTWRTNTEANPYRGVLNRINSNITVHAAEDILVMAAFDFDGGVRDLTNEDPSAGMYAMIGHGGSENWGSFHGNISVTADGRNVDTTGGRIGGAGIEVRSGRGSNSFAQIGHGTHGEGNRRTIYDLTKSGNITVSATTGAVRMLGFNQMPRSGDANTGTYLGVTTPTELGSGADDRFFFNAVQIGHGGYLSAGPEVITTNPNLTFAAGTLAARDIILGMRERPDTSMAGNVSVFAGGNVTIRDIGDTGPGVDPLTAPGTNRAIGVQIWAGNGQGAYGQVGHGGFNHFSNTGLIAANNTGAVDLQAGLSVGQRGNVSVVANQGGILAVGGEERRSDFDDGFGFNFVQVGHGGSNVSAFRTNDAATALWDNNPGFEGNLTVSAGQGGGATAGDVIFRSGRMRSSWAMVGHGGSDSRTLVTGTGTSNIGVTARGLIEFNSRRSAPTEFWLSRDYVDARLIDLNASGFGQLTTFAGTPATGTRIPQIGAVQAFTLDTGIKFAKIGHGGNNFVETDIATTQYSVNNTIDVAAQGGGIAFTAGDRDLDFIQIGHGGYDPSSHDGSIVGGNINVSAAGDVIFDATRQGLLIDQRTTNLGIPIFNANGDVVGLEGLNKRAFGFAAFAQIGNGGREIDGDHSGTITLTATNGGNFHMLAPSGVGAQTVTGFVGHTLQGPSNETNMFGATHSRTALAEAAMRARPFTLFHGGSGGALVRGDIVVNSLLIDTTDPDVRDAPNGDGTTGTLYRNAAVIPGNYAVGTHGAAVGTINYKTGVVTLTERVQAVDTEFQRNVNYSYLNGSATQAIAAERSPESDAALRAPQAFLGHGGLVAGTVSLTVDGDGNGAGRQIFRDFLANGELRNQAQVVVGTIDYSTGRILFNAVANPGGDEVTADYQWDGNKDQSFVQLGNGGLGSAVGDNTTLGHTGRIDVNVAGNIRFHGGEHDGTYAQLGHGGLNAQGRNGVQVNGADLNVDTSGNITVNAGGILEFLAGRGFGNVERSQYAQLGHGGNNADGNHAGLITINAGTGVVSSAPGVVGGGATSAGLNFRAGRTEQAYVQLGHGGYAARSGGAGVANAFGMNGNISVISNGSVNFAAGTLRREGLANNNDGAQYAMIGHGGWDADTTSDGVVVTGGAGIGHNGNILVRSTTGAITFTAGSLLDGSEGAGEGRYHFAQLGHGGFASNGNHSGNITAEAAQNISFLGGMNNSGSASESASYAQLGHGGRGSEGNMGLRDGGGNPTQSIRVVSGGDILFRAGVGQENYAQLGHGGRLSRGDHAANLMVFAEGGLSFTTSQSDHLAGVGPFSGNRYSNTVAGAQNLNDATDGTFSSASLWNQKIVPGTFVLTVQGQATALGSTFTDSRDNATSLTGTIVAQDGTTVVGTINYVTGVVTFTSQLHTGTAASNNVLVRYQHSDSGLAYALLGNGGHDADAGAVGTVGHVGDLSIGARTGSILLQAGNDDQTFAQIGNGGYATEGSSRGNIFVRAAGDVSLLGGTGNSVNTSKFMYAQIGHGGHQSGGTTGHSGSIVVSSGTGALFSNLGTGVFNDVFDTDGNGSKDSVTFGADTSVNGIRLLGGSGLEVAGAEIINDDASAMIGHGGRSSGGNHNGAIAVSAMKDISLLGGTAYRSFVQIGHGGLASNGNLSGNLSVISETGNLAVRAGAPVGGVNTFEAYALIGHGDDRNVNSDASAGTATGNRQGRIYVLADKITLDRSDNDLAFIGHTFRTTTNEVDPFAAQTLATPAANLGGGYQVVGRNGLSYLNNGTMTGGGGASDAGTILINDSFRDRYLTPNLVGGDFTFTGGNLIVDTLLNSTTAYANVAARANHLTFLAGGDIDQNFDIQNPGAGNVNLIAGVDIAPESIVDRPSLGAANYARIDHLQLTPVGTFNVQAIRDDRAQFGQPVLGTGGFGPFSINSAEFSSLAGEISINAAPRAIAVGSRDGSTDLMGYGINLFAGDGANESAQVGFRYNASFVNTTGRIGLRALGGGLHLRAGSGASAAASSQIGHGGTNALGNQQGDLCVQSDGSITFNAVAPGTGIGSYAQIGNGGLNADGNHLGFITVVAGHTTTGNIVMNGGNAADQYVQIGHGGHNADGNFGDTVANGDRGRISVIANTGGNLSITGGSGNGAYGMIGHGDGRGTYGAFGSGSSTGNRQGGIQVFVGGDLNLNAGPSNANVHMIHRTSPGGGLSFPGSYLGGNGYVNVVNGTTSGTGAAGAFENQAVMTAGNFGLGNVYITNSDPLVDVTLTPTTFGDFRDNQSVNTDFSFIVLAAGNLSFQRSIQNQGRGMVALVAGWDGRLDGGSVNFGGGLCNPQIIPSVIDFGNCDRFGQNGKVLTIGNNAQTEAFAAGSRQGPTYLRGHAINLVGSNSTAGASTQVGFRADGSGDITGLIDVRAKAGGINLASGSASTAFTQIGHGHGNGVSNNLITSTATIAVSFCNPGGTITMNGGGTGAYSQIGHGGTGGNYARSGNLSVTNFTGITLNSAGNAGAYTQIGHGGLGGSGNIDGTVLLSGTGTVLLQSGSGAGANSYSMIGSGGGSYNGNISNAGVDLTAGLVTLLSRSGTNAYTQIGSGGFAHSGTRQGDVTVTAATGSVSLGGLASGTGNYSQIGSGGLQSANAALSYSSNTRVSALNGSVLLNSTNAAYAQIGLGGAGSSAVGLTGTISVTAGNAVTLTGGTGANRYAMIGLGGGQSSGTKTGAIDVSGSTVSLTGGSSTSAFAHIGHGGADSTGAISASEIRLDSINTIQLAGGGASAYAQIGHGGYNAINVTVADSNLLINSAVGTGTGNLTITGGTGDNAAAFIGHGGARVNGNAGLGDSSASGNIQIMKAANVSLLGGSSSDAFAQIGHAAERAAGNWSGEISVTTAGAISATGGGGSNTLAMIGHGGVLSGTATTGTRSGQVALSAGGNVTVAAGSGNVAFAQVGHGGQGSRGNLSGTVSVTTTSGTIGVGGAGIDAYGQIGHGGLLASGDFVGATQVIGTGAVTLQGGGNANSYAQIGLGGAGWNGNSANASVDVRGASVSLFSGAGGSSYTQIGSGGGLANAAAATAGNVTGAVNVIATFGGIDVDAGTGARSYSQIGHGGHGRTGDFAGEVQLLAAGNLLIEGGATAGAHAIVGHGGRTDGGTFTTGVRQGNLLASIGGSTTLSDNAAIAFLGHRGLTGVSGASRLALVTGQLSTAATVAGLNGIIAGMIDAGTVEIGVTAGNLVIDGAAAAYDSANHVDLFASGNTTFAAGLQNAGTGAITGVAGWDAVTGLVRTVDTALFPPIASLSLSAAAVSAAPAAYTNNGGVLSVGNGLQTQAISVGSREGLTTMLGDRVVVTGGAGAADLYAQIGYRGTTAADIVGAIDVATGAGGFGILGSSQTGGFAQVGHGGTGAANAFIDANITFRSNDLDVLGGSGASAYARLGHGGNAYANSLSGDITALVPVGDVSVRGGSNLNAAAQIGHGGEAAVGAKSGDISITGASFLVAGGSGQRSWAQVGHGGRANNGALGGNLNLDAKVGSVTVTAGTAAFASAQIGMGGQSSIGAVTPSTISVVSAADVVLAAGNAIQTAAMIGHGGGNAIGTSFDGAVTVTATGNVSLLSGGDIGAFTQIGHGGSQTSGNMSGNVTVTSGNDLSISAPNAIADLAYGKIGHGDDLRMVGAGGLGSRSGNVVVSSNSDISVTQGLIGHKNRFSNATASGQTWIGTSRLDPADAAGGNLVMDANSEISGAGGIRVYVPRRQNNQIASGARLNGVIYTGARVDPSSRQGTDEFVKSIEYPSTSNPGDPPTVVVLNQHDNSLGSGPEPVPTGSYAFYYDTISIVPPPPPTVLPIPLPPTPPGFRAPDYRTLLPDDRFRDDWLEYEEAQFAAPGSTLVFYEGLRQYGPTGEPLFDYRAPSGWSEEEEDILRRFEQLGLAVSLPPAAPSGGAAAAPASSAPAADGAAPATADPFGGMAPAAPAAPDPFGAPAPGAAPVPAPVPAPGTPPDPFGAPAPGAAPVPAPGTPPDPFGAPAPGAAPVPAPGTPPDPFGAPPAAGGTAPAPAP